LGVNSGGVGEKMIFRYATELWLS